MDLKSPTCGPCAKRAGYVAVSPCLTVHIGECANCGEQRHISTASDWKRPGQHVPAAALD